MVRRISVFVVSMVLLVALTFATPSGLAEETPSSTMSFEQRVVDLVNAERQKAALSPLALSSPLILSARQYAAYMASANFFAHEGQDGSTLVTRNQAAGYGSYRFLAENLAAGQSTPEAAMAGWMASPGHRANILSPRVSEIGVGFVRGGAYGYYWVQEFGMPNDLQAVAPASAGSWTSQATTRTVSDVWLQAYRALGGLDNLGEPLSGVMPDPTMGGQTVQFFQRAVLELHPENPAPYNIMRRLLGDVFYPGADAPIDPTDPPPGEARYFPLSAKLPTGLGHFVADYTRNRQPIFFKQYFEAHGGVASFGYPKEEPKLRAGRWTQRFQAAIFEYHPENDRDGDVPGTSVPYRNYRVQLALLGEDYVQVKGLSFR